jgi:hypothetical protein
MTKTNLKVDKNLRGGLLPGLNLPGTGLSALKLSVSKFSSLNFSALLGYGLSLILFTLLLLQPITLTVQDLGRHLTNGRLILQGEWQVLNRNFYSFAYSQQHFTNHHWLSGVIFYLIQQLGERIGQNAGAIQTELVGFQAVHLFHVSLYLGALTFLLKLLADKSNHLLASILGLLASLILALRAEVRPETFGYLFLAHSLWQLHRARKRQHLSKRQIIVLLGQQLFWVNLHLNFIFALFLAGSLLIWQLVSQFLVARSGLTNSTNSISSTNSDPTLPKASRLSNKRLLILNLGLIFVSLLNPHHFQGLLQPFLIWKDYGYPLVENQNLWFLHQVTGSQVIYAYGLIVGTTILLWLLVGLASGVRGSAAISDRSATVTANRSATVTADSSDLNNVNNWSPPLTQTIDVWEAGLALAGIVLGFVALRNMPIFVLLTFPFLAKLMWLTAKRWLPTDNIQQPSLTTAILIFNIFLMTGTAVFSQAIWPRYQPQRLRLGLLPQQSQAAHFFKERSLPGPIFNNYDLGSYLIYHLYPEQAVFVDNRPEAYGQDFWQQVYIPMQEQEEVWQQMLEKFGFKTLFISRYEQTPWFQQFLASRLADQSWELVYQDQFCLILQRK